MSWQTKNAQLLSSPFFPLAHPFLLQALHLPHWLGSPAAPTTSPLRLPLIPGLFASQVWRCAGAGPNVANTIQCNNPTHSSHFALHLNPCLLQVPEALVQELMSPPDLAKFEAFAMRSFVEDNRRMSWCTGLCNYGCGRWGQQGRVPVGGASRGRGSVPCNRFRLAQLDAFGMRPFVEDNRRMFWRTGVMCVHDNISSEPA